MILVAWARACLACGPGVSLHRYPMHFAALVVFKLQSCYDRCPMHFLAGKKCIWKCCVILRDVGLLRNKRLTHSGVASIWKGLPSLKFSVAEAVTEILGVAPGSVL